MRCFDMRQVMHLYAPLCTFMALAACTPPIKVAAPPPPREWMVCEALPERPDLAPLVPFQLSDGRRVYLVDEVNARDSSIARYIVAVRGAWFSCANNLQKVKDYHSKTAE
jgi:hypothetical protein